MKHFTHCAAKRFLIILLWPILLLGANAARAANLLVNPGFEQNSGHALPIGWNYFSPPTNASYFGDFWVENSPPVAHTGTLYWKQWGALYLPAPTNNVAGIYQDFGAVPGNVYQASGWFFVNPNDAIGSN